MEKWLRYKDILRLIILGLNQENVLELRKISEEFNNLFEIHYVKRKEIKFNKYIESEDLRMIEKYDMKNVNLYNCRGNISEGLQYLHNCRIINLRSTNITDENLLHLTNCIEIDISHTKITDNGLKYLRNCTYINLCVCKNITNKGLQNLFEDLYIKKGQK